MKDSLEAILQDETLINESRASLLIQLIEIDPYSDAEQVNKWALEAVELTKDSKDRNLYGQALNMAGNSYWIKGSLGLALDFMQRSLSLAEELEYEPLVARNYGNLGNVYMLARDYPKALDYYRKSLFSYQKLSNELRMFVMYVNLGNIYLKINRLDSAAKYLSLADKAYVAKYKRMLPTLLSNRCDLAFKNGLFDKADSLIQASLVIATELNDIRILSHLNQIEAQIRLHQNVEKEALKFAETAYELGSKTGSLEVLYETTRVLAQAYAQNRLFEQAFDMQNRTNKYLDSLQNDEIRFRLDIFHYSNEQREKEIIENENALNESIANRREIIIYGLMIILALILTTTISIYRNRTRIQRQSKQLKELNDFKTKLFAIISHDIRSPMQTMTSLVELIDNKSLSIEMLQKAMPDVKNRVRSMSGLIEMLLVWTNYNLKGYKVAVDSIKLYHKVEDITKQVHELYSLKNIEVLNKIEKNLVVETDGRVLSIVLNNLIVNAFKFSKEGDYIDVESYVDKTHIVIKIRDYGIGMDPEIARNIFSITHKKQDGSDGEKGEGIGLVLCHDLVTLLSGKIWLESEPTLGTSAFISIPQRNIQ